MPLAQLGVEVHKNAVPGLLSVVPLGHVGDGGVTTHRPVAALKVPEEHVGEALPTHSVAEPVPVKV